MIFSRTLKRKFLEAWVFHVVRINLYKSLIHSLYLFSLYFLLFILYLLRMSLLLRLLSILPFSYLSLIIIFNIISLNIKVFINDFWISNKTILTPPLLVSRVTWIIIDIENLFFFTQLLRITFISLKLGRFSL